MRALLPALRKHMAWFPPTRAEERASAAVHAVGAVLATGATIHLIGLAAATGSRLAVAASAIYGLAAIVTLGASTLFHSAPRGFDADAWRALERDTPRRIALPFRDRELRRARRARRRRVWLAVDHCAIFAMIAGTYTPILLLAFPSPLGPALAGLQWGLAVLGIAIRLRLGHLHWTMIPVFLAMGWFGFVWSSELTAGLGPAGAALLLAGGLVYTAGLVPYLWRSLPFNHAVWHAFVVAGAACHYVVMVEYVLPQAG